MGADGAVSKLSSREQQRFEMRQPIQKRDFVAGCGGG
jgi:hypothetical protein